MEVLIVLVVMLVVLDLAAWLGGVDNTDALAGAEPERRQGHR